MLAWAILFTVLFIASAYLLLPPTLRLLTAQGLVRENYTGKAIPTGLGIYLLLLAIGYGWIMEAAASVDWLREPLRSALVQGGIPFSYPVYLIALTAVGLTSWWDDRWGDAEIKGLKGHWNTLIRDGIVTSGTAKALVALAMAVWISFMTAGMELRGMLGVLLIPLMTNTINLMDVRPGRALKAFTVISLMLIGVAAAAGKAPGIAVYMFPLWVGAFMLFPRDLRGELMIGDTGANLLGFAAGSLWFAVSPVWLTICVVLLLALLHRFAERRSITELIAGIRWLSRMDRWGRTQE